MKGDCIVVTGGAGFIGSHVVGELLALGHRVVVLDNFRTGQRANLAGYADDPKLSIYEVDIIEGLWPTLARVSREVAPVERFIHLAAQTSVVVSIANPIEDVRSNYTVTVQLLEYARLHGVKKVVMASSAAVYGDTEVEKVHEGLPPQPLSPYGIHKLGSEYQFAYYQKVHGVATTALRLFNVYGPRQDPSSPYSGVISIFLERSLAGKPITIFGDGAQTRDFIFVKDVARALVAACLSDAPAASPYNVGTGKTTTIKTLAQEIIASSGSSSEIFHAEARPGEILHSCAEVSRIRDALGFEAKATLRQGLRQTIDWFDSA